MKQSQRRILALLAGMTFFLVAAAVVYMIGMATLEHSPRDFWRSLTWASETLSTTGYGADARWKSPFMVLFVVFVQFVGVFLVFLIVPILLIPFLEERFEEKLPRSVRDMRNHVVVFRYGSAVETLLDRLVAQRTPAVVLETDERVARSLLERGIPVVFARDDEDAIAHASLMTARALVANGSDEENGAIILRARQAGFSGDIYALVEEPVHRRPMELAGATAAYTPRHILAAGLAARASDRISPRLAGLHEVPTLEMHELRIRPGGGLAGKTLEGSGLGAISGVTVVGQWVRGALNTRCDGRTTLEPGGILVVIADHECTDELRRKTTGAVILPRQGPFLVAGFGEVGMKVYELLHDADEDIRVVDRVQRSGVTFVGNVLDPFVLHRAGIDEAQAVILALDSDNATLFATVIIRDAMPDIPIIARVNHAHNVDNIHRAGADFALSISEMSGRMLSYRLLHQDARPSEAHLRIRRVAGAGVAGRTLAEANLRASTGCSVVAISRDGITFSRPEPSFRFERADQLFVCGDEEAIHEIERAPSA